MPRVWGTEIFYADGAGTWCEVRGRLSFCHSELSIIVFVAETPTKEVVFGEAFRTRKSDQRV